MATFLDNSTSTSKTTPLLLFPGEYKVTLQTTDSSASIALFERPDGGTASDDIVVAQGGTAVALTTTDPSKVITVGGGTKYLCQRSGGSAAATVTATRVPSGF